MVAKRWIILVCATLLAAPELLQAATVTAPYVDTGYVGRNNFIDVSALGACVDGVGCRDIFHNLCPETGGCNLERVPRGRCSRADASSAACLWPAGAGSCTLDGNIGCISDADCPATDTCDLTGNNAACTCQGEDSSLATYETTVCGDGGSGINATRGICSDGDDAGAYVSLPGDIGTGGGTIPLCTNIVVLADGLTNCGIEGGQNLKGTLTSKENPGLAPTPQREPGSFGISGGVGTEQMDLQTTNLFQLIDDDPAAGIRRRTSLGESYFTDWVIGNQQFTDAPTSTNGPNTMYCDFALSQTGVPGEPFNADTATPASGVGTTCSVSGGSGCATHQECCGGDACGNANDAADLCTGLTYCHSAGSNAIDQTVFYYVTASASTTGNCPPDCGTSFDFHSQEEQELNRIQQLAVDGSKAAAQTALNNLVTPLAGPGDAVGVTVAYSNTLVGVQDSRCYIGGTPGAPAGEVGRCSGTGTDTCNPENFTAGVDCPGGETCEYCFSSVNQAGICSNDGSACNVGGASSPDCGGTGTCNLPADFALPGGYTSGGFAALDLVSPPGVCASDLQTPCRPTTGNGPGNSAACGGGLCFVNPRVGVLAERPPDVRTPLTLNLVTGNAAVEVRDNDSKVTKDFQTMGQSSGGSPGIGAGDTYTIATNALPAFPTHVMSQTITVAPEDAGVPDGKLMRTYQFGSGADRIVGCIGDSSKALGDGQCNQRLGVAGNPGNTGTDDPILATTITGCSLTCIGVGDTVNGERGAACGPGSDFTAGNGLALGEACNDLVGSPDGSVCGCGGVTAATHRAETLPDKDSLYPTQLVVGGGTALDLDVLAAYDTDAIFAITGTSCPVVGECVGGSNAGGQCALDADCPGSTCGDIRLRCADMCDSLGGDPDGDGICSDGDGSATAGDNYCTGGATTGCDDNCPNHANADQADTGGVQSPQYTPGNGGPDGVGDVCQCGDMNGDGKVNGTDVVLYRRFFAGQPSPFSFDRCSVSPESPPVCNSTDVVLMRRTFGGQPAGILSERVCNAGVSPYVRQVQ